MFVWPGTGQTSVILFLTFIAGMSGVWIVVDMEFRSKLTADIFLGFLAVMICGKGMTEWANAWRDKAPAPPAPPASQQFVAKADSVNAAPAAAAAPAATLPIPAEAATDLSPAPRPRARKRKQPKRKR